MWAPCTEVQASEQFPTQIGDSQTIVLAEAASRLAAPVTTASQQHAVERKAVPVDSDPKSNSSEQVTFATFARSSSETDTTNATTVIIMHITINHVTAETPGPIVAHDTQWPASVAYPGVH